jgi:ABC-type multidrug transport system fused ATPase/permease subunit
MPSGRVQRTLLDAFALFRSAADRYAKRRLLLAIVVVSAGAVLAALAPLALKLALDLLSQPGKLTSGVLPVFALAALYVAGQYLFRCASELRSMLHGHAEQRVRRRVGGRLFEHLVRMPLRFHLDRKLGAMGETVEQGLRGYDLLLQHLVYTVVPVVIEFAAVTAVLVHFKHSAYLIILGAAAVAYVAAFYRWANRIYKPSEDVSRFHIESHAVLTDSLGAHETIKYFDAETKR